MKIDPPLEILLTGDGSYTLLRKDLGETYHSRYGALTESRHVFIAAGLDLFSDKSSVRILEVGFGTGLNAWLSALWAGEKKIPVHYHGLDTLPLSPELCPAPTTDQEEIALWDQIQSAPWNEAVEMNDFFTLYKNQSRVFDASLPPCSLIYFDAFAPRFQPEMWTVDVFRNMFSVLEDNGILVTYCSKGDVRRNMLEAGFRAEKLKGPPGKHHMLRAFK